MRILLRILCLCLCLNSVYAEFDEDEMLFEAIELEASKQLDKARDSYLILYEETQKLEYLKESIVLSASIENPKTTLEFARDYIAQGGKKDIVMLKIFLDCYLKLGLYDEALNETKELMKQDDNPQFQNILGLLYVEKKDLVKAKKAFEANYAQTKSQDSLQSIIEIELAQNNGKAAFEKLDSHIEEYGCNDAFCNFSLDLYIRSKQISKIEGIFKREFDKNPTIQNAQNLVLVYAHQKKFDQASKIASQFPFNHQVMLELYVLQKDFANASLRADLLYEENKNPYFLAIAQVYKFESLKNKSDSKQILSITTKLEQAIAQMQNTNSPENPQDAKSVQNLNIQGSISNQYNLAYFLNFLGYVLIDHELDIKRGVEYVKQALKSSPNEPAYIDSLAWGQYKLKQCTLAQETFKQIPESIIKQEQELQEHKALIQKCK